MQGSTQKWVYKEKLVKVAIQRSTDHRGAFMANILQYPRDFLVWVDETGSDRRDQLRKLIWLCSEGTTTCLQTTSRSWNQDFCHCWYVIRWCGGLWVINGLYRFWQIYRLHQRKLNSNYAAIPWQALDSHHGQLFNSSRCWSKKPYWRCRHFTHFFYHPTVQTIILLKNFSVNLSTTWRNMRI